MKRREKMLYQKEGLSVGKLLLYVVSSPVYSCLQAYTHDIFIPETATYAPGPSRDDDAWLQASSPFQGAIPDS